MSTFLPQLQQSRSNPAPLSTSAYPPPAPAPLDDPRRALSLTMNVPTSMTRTCASGGFSMAIASSRRHRSFFSMYGSPRLAPKSSHNLSPRSVGPSNATSYSHAFKEASVRENGISNRLDGRSRNVLILRLSLPLLL